jgi:hypothetical protein
VAISNGRGSASVQLARKRQVDGDIKIDTPMGEMVLLPDTAGSKRQPEAMHGNETESSSSTKPLHQAVTSSNINERAQIVTPNSNVQIPIPTQTARVTVGTNVSGHRNVSTQSFGSQEIDSHSEMDTSSNRKVLVNDITNFRAQQEILDAAEARSSGNHRPAMILHSDSILPAPMVTATTAVEEVTVAQHGGNRLTGRSSEIDKSTDIAVILSVAAGFKRCQDACNGGAARDTENKRQVTEPGHIIAATTAGQGVSATQHVGNRLAACSSEMNDRSGMVEVVVGAAGSGRQQEVAGGRN